MTRTVVVLRPEPGNGETAARLAALGLRVIRLPLFAVAPVDWSVPPAAAADALLLSSANAVRHGGPGFGALRALPVVAVGAATARAATAAGFTVVLTGDTDAAAAVRAAHAAGLGRLLHLGGRDRVTVVPDSVAVYASVALPVPCETVAALRDTVALLHSARAARRFAALAGDSRAAISLVALSPAVAAAAGPGWQQVAAVDEPRDDALVALAATLAH